MKDIVKEVTKRVIEAKKDFEKEEAQKLLKDLEKVTSKLIQAGNELRDIVAIRGKDMSQWRRQKSVSSDKVKEWVDQLHQKGFINAALDKATNEIMSIEKEIKKFIEKE